MEFWFLLSVLAVSSSVILSQSDEELCPAAADITPCSCDREGINCFNIKNLTQLENVFKAKANKKAARSIWVNGTPLKTLTRTVFNGWKIQQFYFDKNQIETVEEGLFSDSRDTAMIISFYKNNLKKFPFHDLRSLTRLQSLSLGFNQLQDIPAGAFKYNKYLRNIVLMNNKISSIGRTAFDGLNYLERLDLSNNGLTYLDEQVFRSVVAAGTTINVENNLFSCMGCAQNQWLVRNKYALSEVLIGFRCRNGLQLSQLTYRSIGC